MAVSNSPKEELLPKGRGCGWLFFLIMLVIGAAWGAGLGYFMWVLEDARNTITALEDFRPKIGSKVYSADGQLLGEFAIEQRQLVPLSEIPLHVQKAFIATEDAIFYQHKGVRIDAIINAAIYAIQTGRTRGGSTITQQVVRNVEDLQVGLEVTLQRKIREAITALQVEREFTKDEILELYLNQIFLGISANGVESASWQYYDKSVRDISLAEAAVLAGLTRSPNNNNPIRNPVNALARRDIVLDQMLSHQFITPEQNAAAKAEDMYASVVTPEERAQRRAEGRSGWAPNRFEAPYFVEEVRRFLLAQYDKDQLFQEGMEVDTTIDMRIQRAAERVLEEHLAAFDEKKLKQLQAQGKEDEFVPVSGAIVCIDNRPGYKGFVRAMVGGRDWENEKYNTATQARRQPGSSIKPFVWAAGIANGMNPSTIINDSPFSRVDGAGRQWTPGNFDGKFAGPVPIRYALEKSINIVAIKIVEQTGVPLVRSILQDAGITTPIPNSVGLTVALGTPEVTVLDQTVAYSTFANNGDRYEPVIIQAIKDRDGIERYNYQHYQKVEREALDPRVAFVTNSMMQGTTDNSDRSHPTGWRTEVLNRPRGGKTGTTNESRNVWFCGYTADYTAVVWVGYRDNRPLGRGIDYTGGRLACPIWVDFMLEVHEGLPVRDFEPPPGIEFHQINRRTGYKGGNYKEAYIAGNPPPAYAPPPPEPDLSNDLLEAIPGAIPPGAPTPTPIPSSGTQPPLVESLSL